MKTAYLILGLWITTSFSVVSTFLMIRFCIRNERLEEENEVLKESSSKYQALELSRKLENDEVLTRMFEDLEREELIYMNTM